MSGRSEDEEMPPSANYDQTRRANIDLKISNDGGVEVKDSNDERD